MWFLCYIEKEFLKQRHSRIISRYDNISNKKKKYLPRGAINVDSSEDRKVNRNVAGKAVGFDVVGSRTRARKGKRTRSERGVLRWIGAESRIPTSNVRREQVSSRRSARERRESPGLPPPALASVVRTGLRERERLAWVRWPTVTRTPVFPIALALLFPFRTVGFWKLGKGQPDLNGVGAVRLPTFPSPLVERRRTRADHRGFQSRNRPASPSRQVLTRAWLRC